jgi:hypothetical protein
VVESSCPLEAPEAQGLCVPSPDMFASPGGESYKSTRLYLDFRKISEKLKEKPQIDPLFFDSEANNTAIKNFRDNLQDWRNSYDDELR